MRKLHTNITTTLGELDKVLGLATDPIYANLKKLFENAKMKWEVMEVNALEHIYVHYPPSLMNATRT